MIHDSDIDIKETDIIFDCPHCAKSLAIDYRGAGLTIKCSDCGGDVQVPIPDGMELDDLDRPLEDQELQIIQLRRSLQKAQDRIAELESSIEDLMERRDVLERDRSEHTLKMGSLLEKTGVIETALKDITKALDAVSALCRNEQPASTSQSEDD
jgi:chaperonin cofactor prefoldin